MNRLLEHPILGKLPPRQIVRIQFNNKQIDCYEGETVAASLLANNIRTLRVHEESGNPRGIYCNIGHCMECRVTINGTVNQRACLTLVAEGMEVTSPQAFPVPLKKKGDRYA